MSNFFSMTWPPFLWLMVMGTIVVPVLHYQKRLKHTNQPKSNLKKQKEAETSNSNATKTNIEDENIHREESNVRGREIRNRKTGNRRSAEHQKTVPEVDIAKICVKVVNQQTLLEKKTNELDQKISIQLDSEHQESVQQIEDSKYSEPKSGSFPDRNYYLSSKSLDSEDNSHQVIFRASSDTINYSIYEQDIRSKSKDDMSITDNPLFVDPFHDVESVSTVDRSSSPTHLSHTQPQIRSCDRAVQTSSDDLDELIDRVKPKSLAELMETITSDNNPSSTITVSSENLVINLDMILGEEQQHPAFSKPPQTKIPGSFRSFSFQSESNEPLHQHDHSSSHHEFSEAATPKLFQSPERNALPVQLLYQSPATALLNRRRKSSSDMSEVDSQEFHHQQLDGLTIVKPTISEKKFLDPPSSSGAGIAFDGPSTSISYLPVHRVTPEDRRLMLDSWTSLLTSPPPQSVPNSRKNSNTSSTQADLTSKEVLFDQLHRLFPEVDLDKRSPESEEKEVRLQHVPRTVKASPIGNLDLNAPASIEKPMLSNISSIVQVTPASIDSTRASNPSIPDKRPETPPPSTRLELEDQQVEEKTVLPSEESPLPLMPNTEVVKVPSVERLTHLPTDPSHVPISQTGSSNQTVLTYHSHSSASSSNATARTKKSTISQRSNVTAVSKVERSTSNYIQKIDHFIRTRTDFYSPGYYYNVQKLFEALPPPKELKASTIKDYRLFLRKYPHYFKLSSDQKSVELLALTPLLVLNSASSGDEEMLGGYLIPGEGVPVRQSLTVTADNTDNATVSTMSAPLYLYGFFHCVSKYCHKRWNSRQAMMNTAQTCPRCHVRVYPYQLRPLQPDDQDYNDSDDEDKHPTRGTTHKKPTEGKKSTKDLKTRGTKSKKTAPQADEEYEGEGEEELTKEHRKRGISVEGYFDYPHDLQLTNEFDQR